MFYDLILKIEDNEIINIFLYKITINEWFNENIHIPMFDTVIKNINSCSNYKIVILEHNDEDNYIIKKINYNYYKVNISKFIDINISPDWYTPQMDWNKIFNILEVLF